MRFYLVVHQSVFSGSYFIIFLNFFSFLKMPWKANEKSYYRVGFSWIKTQTKVQQQKMNSPNLYTFQYNISHIESIILVQIKIPYAAFNKIALRSLHYK